MTTLRRVMVSKYITRPLRSEDTDAARGISGRSISAWEEVGEAVFHGFGSDYEESSEGFGNYSTAIVEWPTGQVEMVRADKIRFLEPEVDQLARPLAWSVVAHGKKVVGHKGSDHDWRVVGDVRRCEICERTEVYG